MTDYVAILQGLLEKDLQWQEWRTCGRKRRYQTYMDAEAHAWDNVRNSYHCPYCDGFHLTHRKRRKQ